MFDTERALVGGLLGQPGTADRVTLTGSDFANPQLGEVFDVIRQLTAVSLQGGGDDIAERTIREGH